MSPLGTLTPALARIQAFTGTDTEAVKRSEAAKDAFNDPCSSTGQAILALPRLCD